MATNRLVVHEQIDVYAHTLVEAALDQGGSDCALEVRDQLETIAHTYRSSFSLKTALSDPTRQLSERIEIARAAFSGVRPFLLDVLCVIIERNQMDVINRIWQRYGEMLQEQLDMVIIDVTTVVELNDALREQIKQKAQRDLGKQAILRERINPALLGGIVMCVNGRTIDASMLSQLERARNTLKTKIDGGEARD